MPINPEKFILKMINKFDGKYNLPHDILVDVIVTVLNDAPDLYFTYDMVQEHPEFCRKCGSCCRQRDMCHCGIRMHPLGHCITDAE